LDAKYAGIQNDMVVTSLELERRHKEQHEMQKVKQQNTFI
jgi:hypothetical protein